MKKFLLFTLLTCFELTAQDFWAEVVPFSDLSTHYPSEISAVDDQVVWVKASPHTVGYFRFSISTDAGATWTEGDINLSGPTMGVGNLHAVSATTAYAIGIPSDPLLGGGVWVTRDSGATWEQQTTGLVGPALSLVHFFDTETGLVVGDPQDSGFEIFTTTNGGTAWSQVAAANIPPPLDGEYSYTSVFEARDTHFWFGTNMGRIYHSTDMGQHWTVAQSPIPDLGAALAGGSFAFKNGNDGILIDKFNAMWRTHDGGATWNPDTYSGVLRNAEVVYIPETANAFFSWGSDADDILRGGSYSLDDGSLWNDLNVLDANPIIPIDAVFKSNTVGFCIGLPQSNSGAIARFYRLDDPAGLLNTQKYERNIGLFAAPNPTSDVVKLSGHAIQSVIVGDLSGKILSKRDFEPMDEVDLDLSAYQSGVYLATIQNEKGGQTIKIVKN
ncbi:T9SS type A sorting domain-containing protein [Flavobacterium caeni]|uniref:Por secretion system C-terminal sorting domain-containing protein n=1 Tax=Flavobacterium caeni TaxID=490189 RepID=A0A1G5I920_9FLAO|nr:YCF48-related protein [Flavobacterium caeni]SCY72625.1 Por secretion system C-terminal sorting domain-containing protein [Flavobacterium caeni]